MNVKNILSSVGIIVFAGAIVASATGAFFSDTENSIGNVFTAGSVSLSLSNITHAYKGVEGNNGPVTDFFKLNPPIEGRGPSFTFTDLKPLDWGVISGTLVNGENDTYVCARVMGVTEESPFRDMLSFRTGTGPGGTFGEIVDAVDVNEWFSPTPPASNLAALPLTAGQSGSVPLQYCFGKFETNGGCVLDPAVVDYNLAQNQELKIDIEYYAVQQRNNEEFTCESMNPVWEESTRTGGDVSFVEDTQNGTVLQLTTTLDNDSRVRWTNNTLELNLSTFTGISYDSKQVSAFDIVNGNASMRLMIDLDGDLTTADIKEITYEPYYNIFAHNPLNQPSILPNTWQTWKTTPTNGKFWASGGFLESTSGGGAYATNFTLTQVLNDYPTSKIVGISLGMGTYNKGQVVLVDNLIVNGLPVSLQN
jgi:predicted ribosomally synthesized peptide with SipW-like signal peptide